MTTYYHNPQCTKSRLGLELLKEAKLTFEIKEYLKEPLTLEELENLFTKLGKEPQDVVRTKEAVYGELDLGNKVLSRQDWFQMIIENPKLLERPILLTATKAIIGRPPENLKELI